MTIERVKDENNQVIGGNVKVGNDLLLTYTVPAKNFTDEQLRARLSVSLANTLERAKIIDGT